MKTLFFLLALFPLLLQAQADSNVTLRLQLGAYRNTAMGKFDQIKLNELKGAIYTEDIGNGIKRVFVGDYNTPEAAEKALEKIKTMGFESAYIVAVDAAKDKAVKQKNTESKAETTIKEQRSRGGVPSNSSAPADNSSNLSDEKARGRATTPTTPAAASSTPAANNPNKTAEKLNYAIQLGSFSQINFKSFGNVADLGDLTAERADNNTKMYLGTYTSRSDADRILSIVKQRGYTAAFIKTIPIAEK
jgi:cell division protein FtsN